MSLINKYRPKQFSEVKGQDKIVQTLINSIKLNKLHNGYLLAGKYGTGKTTVARLLAKAVNCKNFKNDVCNKCSSCLDAQTDIQEIDAASNRGIDEIRKIKRNSGLIPFFKKYKVYIIDEAHALTSQASNAFLKTLEEPSSRTKFILCTTEPGKLLATIKSRCLPFYFVPIRFYDIKDKLEEITQKEGYNLKDSKILFKIAERSNNTLRDAINYLDLCLQNTEDKTLTLDIIETTLGLIDDKKIYELIDYLVVNRPQKFFTVISSLVSNGKKYEDIIVYLRGQVKEMIFVKKGLTKNISPYKLKIIKEKNYPIDKLFKILTTLSKAINLIQGVVIPKDIVELAFLQIFLNK